MKINWIGQGGFIFESGGYRLVIDPFLSDSLKDKGGTRMMPPPLAFNEVKPDALFFTHDHLDHFDEFTVLPICELHPNCQLMGPKSVVEHIKNVQLTNPVTEFTIGDQIQAGNFKLTILPAYHSDPYSVGVLIESEGFAIYLSGDSLNNPELIPALQEACHKDLDAAIICINGKFNNMSWKDAIEVVTALNPKVAMPMHYGMFYENTVDPKPFIQTCRDQNQRALELKVGKIEDIKMLISNP